MLAAPDFAAALPPDTLAALNDLDAMVVAADGDASGYLARLNARAIVIRPDRHILGVASTAVELDLILAHVPLLATSTPPPRAVANF